MMAIPCNTKTVRTRDVKPSRLYAIDPEKLEDALRWFSQTEAGPGANGATHPTLGRRRSVTHGSIFPWSSQKDLARSMASKIY
jgi:hypothetical protein